MAIAVVNVAVSVSMMNGEVERARIALGSVAPTAVRAIEAEAVLVGETLEEANLYEASELAVRATSPIDDFRASASYRRKMVQSLTLRSLQQVREQLFENGAD
jgi:carbon-monoxide dehydrogenase medium subunit